MPPRTSQPPWISRAILDRAACPACHGELAAADGDLACRACERRFGFHHGIPLLFPGPSPIAASPASPLDLTVVVMTSDPSDDPAAVVRQIRPVLDDLAVEHEVMVVDRGIRAPLDHVRVLDQRGARYGDAFRAAAAEARGEYVLTLDADASHDPGFVRVFWLRRHEADVLSGSRFTWGGEAHTSLAHRLLTGAVNAVFRGVLSLPMRDLSGGFRLYRREALQDLPLRSRDHDVTVEALVQSFVRGWSVVEIPLFHSASGGVTRLEAARQGTSYLSSLLRLWPVRNSVESADYDSRAYNSRIPLQRYWQRERHRIVHDMLDGEQDDILDVGCGSSRILQSLPRAVGLDVKIHALRFMRPTNPLLVGGTIYGLPFKDESFGTVICSQVIEHLSEPVDVVGELRRVLRPGGRLILGTPDYATIAWRVIEPIYDRVLPGAYAEEHVTHYDRPALHDLLRRTGFELIRERYVCGAEWIASARRTD